MTAASCSRMTWRPGNWPPGGRCRRNRPGPTTSWWPGWRRPGGPGGAGDVELAIDLAPFGPADPAHLNGIVAHPDGTTLLVASQGEGGTLWRVSLAGHGAVPVDLGGYEFNADGLLLDGDLLYGVTNRGEDLEDLRFMISVARLAPGWRSATIMAELA